MNKRMLPAALAGLIGLVGCVPAYAADLGNGGYKDNGFVSEPAFDGTAWQGFFFGVQGGWGSYNHDVTNSGNYSETFINPAFDYSSNYSNNSSAQGASGGLFGLTAGYNFRLGRFVVGPQVEYNWTNNSYNASSSWSDTNNNNGGDSFKLQHNGEWSAGGRLGYLFTNSTLVYGSVAFTQYDFSVSGDDVTAANGWNTNNTANGYTLALGMESMFARTAAGDFSYKLEGRFGHAGKTTLRDYNLGGDFTNVDNVKVGSWNSHDGVETEINNYAVMVGINYQPHFGSSGGSLK